MHFAPRDKEEWWNLIDLVTKAAKEKSENFGNKDAET